MLGCFYVSCNVPYIKQPKGTFATSGAPSSPLVTGCDGAFDATWTRLSSRVATGRSAPATRASPVLQIISTR